MDGDAGEDEEDEDTGGGSKSGQKSEVMDEAPKQFGKLNKELPTVQKVMREAVRKLVDNLKTTAEQSDKEDPELQSYRRTAAFRLRLGKVWMSTTVEGAKEFIALSTPALLIKCGVVEPVSKTDAVVEPVSKKDAVAEASDSAQGGADENGDDDAGDDDVAKPAGDADEPALDGGVDGKAVDVRSKSESGGSSRRRAPGPIISKLLQELLMSMGKHGMTVHQAERLISNQHFCEILDGLLAAQSMRDLDNMLTTWRSAADQVKLLATGISRARPT